MGTVALAHAPEGAGNATRMLAVAAELDAAGVDVALAGGGPGTDFLRTNGFTVFEPTSVEFIGPRRNGAVLRALAGAVSPAVRRLRDFHAWLGECDPAVLLADDPFAVAAARARGVPFFRLDHSTVACYDALVERAAFRLFNGYSLRTGEGFFHTRLWDASLPPRAANLRPVDPLAYQPDDPEPVEPFDVLVVPSTFSTGSARVADRLRAAGHDVVLVGGPGWETVPAMTPYAAAADLVVCAGFSAIAEAAVAGTPAVVRPFIDCQRGIAERIDRYGVRGVATAHSTDEVLAHVADPPPDPEFDNGAEQVAADLLDWLDADAAVATRCRRSRT
ncbi:hypothetical protein ACOZ4N_14955 [Halorientalis pallida]|uniref:hypothetical protein n=1 Tax=Halorientalis pallida TaxID=2479928 RepID=UPI003C6F72F2